MKYKLLVLDVDGTLLNNQKEISPRTLAALLKVQQMGVHIVLASGRPTNGVMPIAEKLELNHYGESYPDVEKLSEQWRAYDIFPMASNVQFVFFHKKGSTDVLVKVLLNEKETKLPVKTDVAPYYHWKDVESYYREKLDKYQHI